MKLDERTFKIIVSRGVDCDVLNLPSISLQLKDTINIVLGQVEMEINNWN